MTTWDILTGKKVSDHALFDEYGRPEDFYSFERFKTLDTDIYMAGIYNRVLMVSKEPLELDDNTYNTFYDE